MSLPDTYCLKDLFGAPRSFGKLKTRFGNFRSWNEIPPNLREPPAAPEALPAPEETPPPAPVAPAAEHGWRRTGEGSIARRTLDEALGYRITEIFNFTAGTYTQMIGNLDSKAETQALMDISALPTAKLVSEAAEEFRRQGGEVPEDLRLPNQLAKSKVPALAGGG